MSGSLIASTNVFSFRSCREELELRIDISAGATGRRNARRMNLVRTSRAYSVSFDFCFGEGNRIAVCEVGGHAS